MVSQKVWKNTRKLGKKITCWPYSLQLSVQLLLTFTQPSIINSHLITVNHIMSKFRESPVDLPSGTRSFQQRLFPRAEILLLCCAPRIYFLYTYTSTQIHSSYAGTKTDTLLCSSFRYIFVHHSSHWDLLPTSNARCAAPHPGRAPDRSRPPREPPAGPGGRRGRWDGRVFRAATAAPERPAEGSGHTPCGAAGPPAPGTLGLRRRGASACGRRG